MDLELESSSSVNVDLLILPGSEISHPNPGRKLFRCMVMETLIEKAERIIATLLETMQEETDSSDGASSAVDDDSVAIKLNTEDHHESAVLCW